LASEFIHVSCLFLRDNPKYSIKNVAVQHVSGAALVLLLTVVAWLYVALMMAVAEATHSGGTVLGAVFTFVLYGVGPVALLVYLMGRPMRRAAREAREAREAHAASEAAAAAPSGQPDGGGEAPADAVAPVRKEP
jgi:hypothetical protein